MPSNGLWRIDADWNIYMNNGFQLIFNLILLYIFSLKKRMMIDIFRDFMFCIIVVKKKCLKVYSSLRRTSLIALRTQSNNISYKGTINKRFQKWHTIRSPQGFPITFNNDILCILFAILIYQHNNNIIMNKIIFTVL